MAAIAFILFAISAGDAPPDFTALAQFRAQAGLQCGGHQDLGCAGQKRPAAR